MSSILAIAFVTAVLKSLLENGLIQRGVTASIGSEALVSAVTWDELVRAHKPAHAGYTLEIFS